MGYQVAVVGATGAVGRQILSILAERRFPISQIYAVASARSAGRAISFGDKTLKVHHLDTFDFKNIQIALFSPGGAVSAVYAPIAAAAGAYVIDNTSHFRMEADVPLVVPEVNGAALAGAGKRRIIANPNCSTIQMVMALAPLHRQVPIKRVSVATYQSVSGAGQKGMDELEAQTKAVYMNEKPQPATFPKQIAFNAIPRIDVMQPDGFTKEEHKMRMETQKILDPQIQVVATCVRVPVFIGHSAAVHVEFHEPITLAQAKAALKVMPGVMLMDREDFCLTPLDAMHEDTVYVSRLRVDPSVPHGLAFWVVADNLRKGAALNAVQIAESLVSFKIVGF